MKPLLSFWPGSEPYPYNWKVKCVIDISVMKLYIDVIDYLVIDHLSNATALVNSYTWFSIFLLGCGSPYMGTSFSGLGDGLPPRN